MNIFKRRQKTPTPPPNTDVLKAPIEIVTHHNASKEAKAEVIKAQEHLNKIFEENHFTLKIYLAAGGQLRNKKKI